MSLGTGTDHDGITGETDAFQPGEPIWVEVVEKSTFEDSYIDLQLMVQQSDETVHRGVIAIKSSDQQTRYELPLNLVAGEYDLQLFRGGELAAAKPFTVQTRDIPDYEVIQETNREEGIIELRVVTSASTPVELGAVLHDLQALREEAEVIWVHFHEAAAGSYGSIKASAGITHTEEGASRIGVSHPKEYFFEMKN